MVTDSFSLGRWEIFWSYNRRDEGRWETYHVRSGRVFCLWKLVLITGLKCQKR
jgi:hypothetical protein